MAVKRTSASSRPAPAAADSANPASSSSAEAASGDGAAGDPPPGAQSGSPLPRWSAETEVAVVAAFLSYPYGHKPLGPAKHFQMALVTDKLHRAGYRDVTPAQIWAYLDSRYDMDALDRMHWPQEGEEGEAGAEVEVGESGEDAAGDKTSLADLKDFTDFVLPDHILHPESSRVSSRGSKAAADRDDDDRKTPKSGGASSSKRPTRSTPGVTPNKRRK